MGRRRRRTGKSNDSWLSRWLSNRQGIRERFCSKCHQPYLQSPEAKAEEQFCSNSAAALLYPTRRFGRTGYQVRVGRWQANSRRLELVQMFDAEDIADLRNALRQAERYIARMKVAGQRQPKPRLQPVKR